MTDAKAVSRALHEIDSRATVGVNVGEYTRLVGEARVAYDENAQETGPCAEA